jgi:hypothetical protein
MIRLIKVEKFRDWKIDAKMSRSQISKCCKDKISYAGGLYVEI